MMGGVSVELWRIRIGCFVMPKKCKTHLKTLKPVTMSLAIRLVLFYLLVVEGVESNPGPPGPSRRSNTAGARGNRSPRGRGGRGGRRDSVNTGGPRWGDTNDIFAAPSVETSTSQMNSGDPPYSLRRTSRPQSQPSLSTWLTSSQPQSQAQLSDLGQPNSTPVQSDMDLVSETSEQQLETDDNFDETNTTSLLLEIRRDVKKMNKKFDSLEKSVRTLKHDSKLLKEQNAYLTKQVSELQTTVLQLESRTRETEKKNERLEAQSRRDNLRFHGLDDKMGETWEESETKVRDYISNGLGIDESTIRVERAHRIRSKISPRPIIVKFSHYKDRDKVLKVYREKRKTQRNDQTVQADAATNGADENRTDKQPEITRQIRVSEDFPERVVKACSRLYSFLKSSLESGRQAFLRYDCLIVDGQEFEYDYERERPVPVQK